MVLPIAQCICNNICTQIDNFTVKQTMFIFYKILYFDTSTRAFFIIYNLTKDGTIISKIIITNNELARHNELPEDDILNVETCRSMLFVIIVFDIIVQSLVKLLIIKNARYWYQNKGNPSKYALQLM
jgi:hypothetical protein